jgi:hypothetical protein
MADATALGTEEILISKAIVNHPLNLPNMDIKITTSLRPLFRGDHNVM